MKGESVHRKASMRGNKRTDATPSASMNGFSRAWSFSEYGDKRIVERLGDGLDCIASVLIVCHGLREASRSLYILKNQYISHIL